MSRKPSSPAAVSGETDEERARRRLALVRVLIWAQREAAAMELGETSDLLHEAIAALDLPEA
ncbi:hypothetical protein P2H44_17715 [Albimonas sp. CAU 1670]|uniref:hypothetical protein n=1 Tax=Albimonas sp. CAU 1670 TaxID=3032599 RepID=UPI0023D9D895|nr:hypothetical protein [Albimonas sp. CAU 1670]MDF2234399.1 hypothetical protein [Albimonas sp. CAU 1670]